MFDVVPDMPGLLIAFWVFHDGAKSESLQGRARVRFRWSGGWAGRAYFNLRMADQWLSWRLDCISACLILVVAMLAISQRNTLSPSLTALSLSEVLDVTGFLKYAVQVRVVPLSFIIAVRLCLVKLMQSVGHASAAPPAGASRKKILLSTSITDHLRHHLFFIASQRFYAIFWSSDGRKRDMQAAAMFESRFNSVERLLAYVGLPQEAAAYIEDTK